MRGEKPEKRTENGGKSRKGEGRGIVGQSRRQLKHGK